MGQFAATLWRKRPGREAWLTVLVDDLANFCQNRTNSASRSRRGFVITVTGPPSPQFADEEPAQADFGRYGDASLPSETASVVAALLFRTLNTWASGSNTKRSWNLITFFKPRSSWFRRGVRTWPGATRLMVSEACPRTVPVGNTRAPGVQPTQWAG